MEDKDQLKEILSNINNINEPIDLEASIMQSIRNEESFRLYSILHL